MILIFDCDGVLVDSPVLSVIAEASCYSEAGIFMTPEGAMERFGGISDTDVVRILEKETGITLPIDMKSRINLKKQRLYADKLKAIDGVQDALKCLRSIPSCVASSLDSSMLDYILRLVNLFDYFRPNIYSSDMVPRGKPHPDLFLFAARNMNANSDSAIILEDSVAGVQAGKAAGAYVVGFTGGSHCGSGHASILRAAGADTILTSMSDLPKVLSKFP